MGRPSSRPCPCCGLDTADARSYHLAEARTALEALARRHHSINGVARVLAERLEQPLPTVQRRVARVIAGMPPSEPFVDLLRTMTGALAPYQLDRP